MEWETVLKVGKPFKVDGKLFYDLAVGPGDRRMVVAGAGVLDRKYGFCWYWRPKLEGKDQFTHLEAAKVLVEQFRFSLIDYRTHLLALGKLEDKSVETGFTPNRILENTCNRVCSDRDYAKAA